MTEWSEPPIHDENTLYDIVDVLTDISDARGVSAAQVTLAWTIGRWPPSGTGGTWATTRAASASAAASSIAATTSQPGSTLSATAVNRTDGDPRAAPRRLRSRRGTPYG
ncbi:hypothetical protein [Geodermatophilus sp. TF02-6]|uniref:hypothetical protein n=1 Tax=Geodermatophilus sp. TF02-6 TaxID=2250575 RepID=UPI0018F69B97|nr:hypothetical protein [Geodermatophilus sp. TF02-6]